jgi:hypothetical protein
MMEEVYRFSNKQSMAKGHSCWNLNDLKKFILDSLKAVLGSV